MSGVEHKQASFEIVCVEGKTLVRTNLQVFLLSAPGYGKYIDRINSEYGYGRVKDFNELCGMFLHEDRGKPIVNMIPVKREWYV